MSRVSLHNKTGARSIAPQRDKPDLERLPRFGRQERSHENRRALRRSPPEVLERARTRDIIDDRRGFHRIPLAGGAEEIPREVEELLTGSTVEARLAWIAEWTRTASRVCRMTLGDMAATGILIGPDLVLTSDHNVNILKNVPELARYVRFMFDYHDDPPGPGAIYSLAADWLVESSPPSLADEQPEPKTREATENELDYAIVRLNGAPAADIVDGRERGVIELPHEPYVFAQGEPLMILQHTFEEPLRMTLATFGILSVNAGNTRVAYLTNTRDGASGAPCFDPYWRLVALHHGGSPGGWPPYNEGIPIHTIRKHLGSAALAALGFFNG